MSETDPTQVEEPTVGDEPEQPGHEAVPPEEGDK
jgi:hypothetical protein